MAQTPSILAAGRVASTAKYNIATRNVVIRDTSELKKKIDLAKYKDSAKVNPTNLVVVDQFPKAGEQVPKGTPVTLTFMSRDSIQVKDIAELSQVVMKKYEGQNIKKITDDIQAEEEVKKVLENNKEYEEMSPVEKDAVKKYAVKNGFLESEPDDVTTGLIYNDLSFIYNI